MRPSPFKGFTLIELMLVVAIIGLLAAIALPKFGNLIIRAKEASTKGHLGTVRSATTIYYSDNEGTFFRTNGITTLRDNLVPKYIQSIPKVSIPTVPDHIPGNNDSGVPGGFSENWFPSGPDNAIGYQLAVSGLVQFTGEIVVACVHLDSNGRIWTTW